MRQLEPTVRFDQLVTHGGQTDLPEVELPKTVVICGSMKTYPLMVRIRDKLRSAGLNAVAPVPDEPSTCVTLEHKRAASKAHMDRIREQDTEAVLVVNVSWPGKVNYVGPCAFAEVGLAFALGRQAFLLHGMPAAYEDELSAWGVKCLHGQIKPLLDALAAPHLINSSDWEQTIHFAPASGQ